MKLFGSGATLVNSLLGVTSFDMVVEGVLIFVFSFAKRTNGLEETDFFFNFLAMDSKLL